MKVASLSKLLSIAVLMAMGLVLVLPRTVNADPVSVVASPASAVPGQSVLINATTTTVVSANVQLSASTGTFAASGAFVSTGEIVSGQGTATLTFTANSAATKVLSATYTCPLFGSTVTFTLSQTGATSTPTASGSLSCGSGATTGTGVITASPLGSYVSVTGNCSYTGDTLTATPAGYGSLAQVSNLLTTGTGYSLSCQGAGAFSAIFTCATANSNVPITFTLSSGGSTTASCGATSLGTCPYGGIYPGCYGATPGTCLYGGIYPGCVGANVGPCPYGGSYPGCYGATPGTCLYGGFYPSCTGTGGFQSPSPAMLNQPAVTCQGNQASVAFSWTPATIVPIPGFTVAYLDLTLQNNGFLPGTFLGRGPLDISTNQIVWNGILPGLVTYWRVNTLTASGWVTSAVGSFTPCGSGFTQVPTNQVTYSCTGAGTARVTFNWGQPTNGFANYLDISLYDNGFAPGSFIGTTVNGLTAYSWPGILANLPTYWRVNSLQPYGWTQIAGGSFIALC